MAITTATYRKKDTSPITEPVTALNWREMLGWCYDQGGVIKADPALAPIVFVIIHPDKGELGVEIDNRIVVGNKPGDLEPITEAEFTNKWESAV